MQNRVGISPMSTMRQSAYGVIDDAVDAELLSKRKPYLDADVGHRGPHGVIRAKPKGNHEDPSFTAGKNVGVKRLALTHRGGHHIKEMKKQVVRETTVVDPEYIALMENYVTTQIKIHQYYSSLLASGTQEETRALGTVGDVFTNAFALRKKQYDAMLEFMDVAVKRRLHQIIPSESDAIDVMKARVHVYYENVHMFNWGCNDIAKIAQNIESSGTAVTLDAISLFFYVVDAYTDTYVEDLARVLPKVEVNLGHIDLFKDMDVDTDDTNIVLQSSTNGGAENVGDAPRKSFFTWAKNIGTIFYATVERAFNGRANPGIDDLERAWAEKTANMDIKLKVTFGQFSDADKTYGFMRRVAADLITYLVSKLRNSAGSDQPHLTDFCDLVDKTLKELAGAVLTHDTVVAFFILYKMVVSHVRSLEKMKGPMENAQTLSKEFGKQLAAAYRAVNTASSLSPDPHLGDNPLSFDDFVDMGVVEPPSGNWIVEWTSVLIGMLASFASTVMYTVAKDEDAMKKTAERIHRAAVTQARAVTLEHVPVTDQMMLPTYKIVHGQGVADNTHMTVVNASHKLLTFYGKVTSPDHPKVKLGEISEAVLSLYNHRLLLDCRVTENGVDSSLLKSFGITVPDPTRYISTHSGQSEPSQNMTIYGITQFNAEVLLPNTDKETRHKLAYAVLTSDYVKDGDSGFLRIDKSKLDGVTETTEMGAEIFPSNVRKGEGHIVNFDGKVGATTVLTAAKTVYGSFDQSPATFNQTNPAPIYMREEVAKSTSNTVDPLIKCAFVSAYLKHTKNFPNAKSEFAIPEDVKTMIKQQLTNASPETPLTKDEMNARNSVWKSAATYALKYPEAIPEVKVPKLSAGELLADASIDEAGAIFQALEMLGSVEVVDQQVKFGPIESLRLAATSLQYDEATRTIQSYLVQNLDTKGIVAVEQMIAAMRAIQLNGELGNIKNSPLALSIRVGQIMRMVEEKSDPQELNKIIADVGRAFNTDTTATSDKIDQMKKYNEALNRFRIELENDTDSLEFNALPEDKRQAMLKVLTPEVLDKNPVFRFILFDLYRQKASIQGTVQESAPSILQKLLSLKAPKAVECYVMLAMGGIQKGGFAFYTILQVIDLLWAVRENWSNQNWLSLAVLGIHGFVISSNCLLGLLEQRGLMGRSLSVRTALPSTLMRFMSLLSKAYTGYRALSAAYVSASIHDFGIIHRYALEWKTWAMGSMSDGTRDFALTILSAINQHISIGTISFAIGTFITQSMWGLIGKQIIPAINSMWETLKKRMGQGSQLEHISTTRYTSYEARNMAGRTTYLSWNARALELYYSYLAPWIDMTRAGFAILGLYWGELTPILPDWHLSSVLDTAKTRAERKTIIGFAVGLDELSVAFDASGKMRNPTDIRATMAKYLVLKTSGVLALYQNAGALWGGNIFSLAFSSAAAMASTFKHVFGGLISLWLGSSRFWDALKEMMMLGLQFAGRDTISTIVKGKEEKAVRAVKYFEDRARALWNKDSGLLTRVINDPITQFIAGLIVTRGADELARMNLMGEYVRDAARSAFGAFQVETTGPSKVKFVAYTPTADRAGTRSTPTVQISTETKTVNVPSVVNVGSVGIVSETTNDVAITVDKAPILMSDLFAFAHNTKPTEMAQRQILVTHHDTDRLRIIRILANMTRADYETAISNLAMIFAGKEFGGTDEHGTAESMEKAIGSVFGTADAGGLRILPMGVLFMSRGKQLGYDMVMCSLLDKYSFGHTRDYLVCLFYNHGEKTERPVRVNVLAKKSIVNRQNLIDILAGKADATFTADLFGFLHASILTAGTSEAGTDATASRNITTPVKRQVATPEANPVGDTASGSTNTTRRRTTKPASHSTSGIASKMKSGAPGKQQNTGGASTEDKKGDTGAPNETSTGGSGTKRKLYERTRDKYLLVEKLKNKATVILRTKAKPAEYMAYEVDTQDGSPLEFVLQKGSAYTSVQGLILVLAGDNARAPLEDVLDDAISWSYTQQ